MKFIELIFEGREDDFKTTYGKKFSPEKLEAIINMVNEKNKLVKDQIIEVRRKINLEKENLCKLNQTLNQKTNELIGNQGKLLQ